jgi:hypothetical protein
VALRTFLLAPVTALVVGVSATSAAAHDGWFVRVCPAKTETNRIYGLIAALNRKADILTGTPSRDWIGPERTKTTPSSISPVVTKRQSAMSSLRASATIIVLRVPARRSAVRAWYHRASALSF